ncbi:uncharacterized protein BX663DRAFT_516013, partial [Cokeromyces recurvatus]|uniref:uncharacterized protein n=1 Tax=Cokeromyces recurvatus TaxID=90255 RepID=UPI0022200677
KNIYLYMCIQFIKVYLYLFFLCLNETQVKKCTSELLKQELYILLYIHLPLCVF